jgi:hypothetical protein
MTQHRSPSPDSHLALAPSAETAAPPTVSDPELKARHRAMWASGDYPSMVETSLLPLGPRLVDASGIGPGMRVLDVAAGTGNASIGPFAPPPPPGAQPPPLWGSETHLIELFGGEVELGTPERDVPEVTAVQRPRDFGEHFKALYGPTIAAQANARRYGRIAELEAALDRLCDEWNRGTPDRARFELQYLLAVGTRA